MTLDHYNDLCERFQLEVALEKMALEKKFKLKRSLFFYVGTPQTVAKVRKQWEAAKQEEFETELAYRTARCEKEVFGISGQEGAKIKIKDEKSLHWLVKVKKVIQRFWLTLSQAVVRPFASLYRSNTTTSNR